MYDPYFRTQSKHSASPPTVKVAEPCMVNPNGRQTAKANIKIFNVANECADKRREQKKKGGGGKGPHFQAWTVEGLNNSNEI